MSCAKTIQVKCGAPAIRVIPEESVAHDLYKVWFLEYDSTKIDTAQEMFSERVKFENRKNSGVMKGMAKLDQDFAYSGLASEHIYGYPGYDGVDEKFITNIYYLDGRKEVKGKTAFEIMEEAEFGLGRPTTG